MAYKSFRDFLTDIKRWGELKEISGAHWDLEMSTIAEIAYREGKRPVPAFLFDDIPGYPKGFRTLFGILTSPRRIASALCLPLPEDKTDVASVTRSWAAMKQREIKLITPKFVTSGLVQENSFSGEEVDLTKFPAPRCHELDTPNRYIGTGHCVIQMDPDEGWVNMGTYRVMLVDHNRVTLHICEGKHGSIIYENRYLSKGKVMPAAVAIGMEPTLWFTSQYSGVPWGVSEYDYAGGIKGEPIEVIKGPQTGLPLPAHAEIVLEGECHPGEYADEGPFGEWHGYYANLGLTPVPEPVMRVKAVYHRDDPILTSSSPAVPRGVNSLTTAMSRAAAIWAGLDKVGLPGIQAVWCPEETGSFLSVVVSIKQMYAGHSRDVGLIALQLGGSHSRHCIVVDDDIDPYDGSQIAWAMATRADPERSIQIVGYCASSTADPIIPEEEKRKARTAPKPLVAPRILVDACRPYEHKAEWYPIARASSELRAKILEKWGSELKELF